ncbi:Oxygen-dependent choline dehydrogenase [Ceratocystis fimbriata CBS 114723]|uniref:Oxygen-dependent choline dehydrogenase n=1 Tax=Ceratocystis fimbriata CBS 114723 TaxID=1035309 RepID=A0A2C5WWX5_9PEZI|nr:Oxygen-dependent choline dehydrogenase [Ceratocystis fimbriata CBS 114723]
MSSSLSNILLFGFYAASALGAAVNKGRPNGQGGRRCSPFVTKDQLLPTYDYVVVGSGPGGGPLASRLARAGKKVLLIEAGDDRGDSDLSKVPGLQINVGEDPETRWSYFVDHYTDPAQQDLDSKQAYLVGEDEYVISKAESDKLGTNPPRAGILYPRAGTLGGCASHNAMITTTPMRRDWNSIAQTTGDSSWDAVKMRNYFARLERNTYMPAGTEGHGFDGWLSTSLTNLDMVLPDQAIMNILTGAARTFGIETAYPPAIELFAPILAQDINNASATRDHAVGMFQVPMATKEGVRSGPRDFIMETATATKQGGGRLYHLDILVNTLATKIKFDTSAPKPRATGVDFISGRSLYSADPRSNGQAGVPGSVKASKEVIISAGTFNTPQLLKLSGIGPKQELASFGINTLVDLPGVGENMQDRYEATMNWKASEPFQIIQNCTFNRDGDPCLATWKQGSAAADRGIYHSNGAPLGVILKSQQTAADEEPDLFLFGGAVNFRGYYPGYSVNTTADSQHWTWGVLKTRSRNHAGTVKLRSTNPRDMPAINFNSFSGSNSGADAQAVVEGLNFIRSMYSNLEPGFGNFTEVWPGPQVTNLEEFVRNEAWGHHACCTAKIGADGDAMAVLDSEFRVRGTNGLRVVDASVFPDIPNYFIATSIYMASEKAADVILKA